MILNNVKSKFHVEKLNQKSNSKIMKKCMLRNSMILNLQKKKIQIFLKRI